MAPKVNSFINWLDQNFNPDRAEKIFYAGFNAGLKVLALGCFVFVAAGVLGGFGVISVGLASGIMTVIGAVIFIPAYVLLTLICLVGLLYFVLEWLGSLTD